MTEILDKAAVGLRLERLGFIVAFLILPVLIICVGIPTQVILTDFYNRTVVSFGL